MLNLHTLKIELYLFKNIELRVFLNETKNTTTITKIKEIKFENHKLKCLTKTS